jgi:hypothetical protein
MFKGQCPKCGFSLSLGSVLKFYWQHLSHSLTRTTALRCPKCGFPNPLKAVSCERCHCDITVAGAATTVTEPARRRWQDFKRNASRGTMWRLQWAYLVFSVVLLWSLLSYVEKHGGKFWPFYMLLSIVYVAVLSYFALWLIPRKNFIGLFRFASRLVKLGLALNGLSLMLIVQLLIKGWLARALILAGLFFVAWVAAFLLYFKILPMTAATEAVFLGSGSEFDPQAPQGRSARTD